MKIGDRFTVDIPDERKWHVKLWHRLIGKKPPCRTIYVVTDSDERRPSHITREGVGEYTVHWTEKK